MTKRSFFPVLAILSSKNNLKKVVKPVTTKEVVFHYENSSGSITGSFAESAIGKSVFLNKSEAEAKLKELRGEENDG